MSAPQTILHVSGFLLFAVFAFSASAQQRPDYGTPVTIDQAKKIAAGIVAECKSNKWNVAVAVADTAGNLVYFERMDDTQTAGPAIAVEKARTAAKYLRSWAFMRCAYSPSRWAA